MMGKDPKVTFLHRNKYLLSTILGCYHLLEMSTKNPTPCKELVTVWPHYIGVKDVSSHEIGGIIMGKEKAFISTVFCFDFPGDVK